MTEIPEHLLKRSKQAKEKASGDAAPAPEGAAAPPAMVERASVPATKAASVPAVPTAPPPPKPDIAVVAAYKERKKIPFWAMLTLSILPLWAFMYTRGLTPKEPTVSGPLGEGAAVYTANCSGCHGGQGEGGLGYAFAGGEVLKTFPHIEDQLRFVYLGTSNYQLAGVGIYGNPVREGGPHNTGNRGIMPNFGPTTGGALSEAQILGVICHERYTLGGADPTADYAEEYGKWCSPEAPAWLGLEDGSLTFENIAAELEDTFVVGLEPAPGNPPDATP